MLGCQLWLAGSLADGTVWAAERSLPGMSLAFALMAAINGSTGSSATLSFGLDGTKPRRRQPNGSKILVPQGWRRKPSETLSCESAADRDREWENAPQRSHLLSHKPEQVPFVVRR